MTDILILVAVLAVVAGVFALAYLFACCLIRALFLEAFRWRVVDLQATDNPHNRVRYLARRYPTQHEVETLHVHTHEALQRRKDDGL